MLAAAKRKKGLVCLFEKPAPVLWCFEKVAS
jgi:hypothetical protein